MTLTKEVVEKWLDKIIKLHKQLYKARILTDDIWMCSDSMDIHLITGLEQIAEILGVEYYSTEWDVEGSQYKEKLYFDYKGVTVMQLGRTDGKNV